MFEVQGLKFDVGVFELEANFKHRTSNFKQYYIPGNHGLLIPALKGQGTATSIINRAITKSQKALLNLTISGTGFFAMPYPNVIITIASIINVGCSTQKNRKNLFFITLSPLGKSIFSKPYLPINH